MVQQFFKVGTVYQKSARRTGRLPAWVFEVTKRDDIYNVIIPFFKRHKLLGYKAKSFDAFCQIAEMVKGRQDVRKLSKEELSFIRKLKLGMNKHYGSLSAGKPLA
ncbi:MAG: LAGLIDADG homing endonuclease [Candidatus Woesebacteria bacterium]|nr:MAG: LAGLIDADG homing endonuclease [Candidatus Woesebacteria bacterium]